MRPVPTSTSSHPSSSNVRAVARAVKVLRAFSSVQPHLSLTEIVQRTELDKGTIRRLLLTLIKLDLVTQDPMSHEYSLALGMLEFGAAVPVFRGLADEAAPFLAKLAQVTQSTAFLSVYESGDALCLARVHGDNAVHVRWWNVGGRMAVNTGGGPMVLLAFQPESELRRRLEKGQFPRLTPATETTPSNLIARLEKIRQRGWELATDDVFVGLSALGVPVRSREGALVAALSIGGLNHHLVENNRPRFLPEVLDCARSISEILR